MAEIPGLTLVLGGARSGKTARAMALAEATRPSRVYVATAEALDDEMSARIARHQAERGTGWRTAEAPLDLLGALHGAAADEVVLVDCLTLWASNLMHADRDPLAEVARLLAEVALHAGPVLMVSNEVGLGIVPETALGRRFRDVQGLLNQRVAARAARVELVAAGLPFLMKG